MEHWTMREGANDLAVRVVNHGTLKDIECLCGKGRRYVEGEWPIHGWTFHAGQCCECMNIRVYSNGASPDMWNTKDTEYAYENSDEIHICDLDAFIEMLQAVKQAKEAAATPEP
jgi:hypothetical protein